MPTFQTIARTRDIPQGRGRAFQVGDHIIAVFEVAGTYFAIDDLCPHMGASLAEGELQEGIVTCPWHAWRFRVSDGTWCDNTRVKTRSYEVRVVDEEIQVLIPDDD
jgi:nitrite reductase (NADH) small subunit